MHPPSIARRGALGLLGGTALSAWIGGIPVALAQAATSKRFVFVILRGALDGLAAVPPYADPDYRPVRGSLALAPSGQSDGLLDLDGRFGLHPGLAPLHELHRSGELAVLHAVGNGTDSRSHFAAQAEMELGGVAGAAEGWLTRLLGATRSPIDAPIRALIERGKDDGTFRADVPSSWILNAMGALLFAAWEGVRDGDLAPRDTPGLVTETLLSGLAGREGKSG